MDNHRDDAADVLVIFGITGDLARRMTFRALYRLERRGLLDCPIIGVASDDMTIEQLVKHAREAIVRLRSGRGRRGLRPVRPPDVLPARRRHATPRSTAASPPDRRPAAARCTTWRCPRPCSAPIVEQLGAAKLLRDGRVAVEKPFGHDLASARDLDARLHRLLRESQILRVDHFLGKEPVIELEYLRFANLALAELWDRKSVSCVQITMAEDFGVEDRGRFYDSVGALRDVVQNHLLQVLALVAMDPPAGASADDTAGQEGRGVPRHAAGRSAALRARPVPGVRRRPRRGQRLGHRDLRGAAAGDRQLALGRTSPIFLRAGKALPHRVTEVRLILRRTPRLAFLPRADPGRAQSDRAAHRPGPGPAAAAVRAGRTVLAHGPPGHLVRPRARRAAGAIRACCCTPR